MANPRWKPCRQRAQPHPSCDFCITAFGVLMPGALFAAMGGSYPKVGATCGLIYLFGLIVIWWAPDTSKKNLQE